MASQRALQNSSPSPQIACRHSWSCLPASARCTHASSLPRREQDEVTPKGDALTVNVLQRRAAVATVFATTVIAMVCAPSRRGRARTRSQREPPAPHRLPLCVCHGLSSYFLAAARPSHYTGKAGSGDGWWKDCGSSGMCLWSEPASCPPVSSSPPRNTCRVCAISGSLVPLLERSSGQ